MHLAVAFSLLASIVYASVTAQCFVGDMEQ